MNVRLSEGLLRFRLTEHDVDTISQLNELSLTLPFAESENLEFKLQLRPDVSDLPLIFVKNAVVVNLVSGEFHDWLQSSEIEYTPDFALPNLKILIEKDLMRKRST